MSCSNRLRAFRSPLSPRKRPFEAFEPFQVGGSDSRFRQLRTTCPLQSSAERVPDIFH